MPDHDLIIVGAGVAGLTAAIIAGRHGLNVIVIATSSPGGQIVNADRIENFPGILQPIAGHELGTLLFEQAEAAGAQFMLDTVEGLRVEGEARIIRATTQEVSASAVIVAAGSTLRKLGIPGEEEFLGKGVSYCASCDAPLFKGRDVCVIGGGDAAFDEARRSANTPRMSKSFTAVRRLARNNDCVLGSKRLGISPSRAALQSSR